MALGYRSTRPALPTITQTNQGAGSANSGDFPVDGFDQLAIDINFTVNSGTPSVTFFYNRKGSDGQYYPIWSPAALTATGKTSTSIGIGGPVNHSVGFIGQISWTIAGTTPNVSFTISVYGK